MKKDVRVLPISEADFFKMTNNINVYRSYMPFNTTFPDDTPNIESWEKKCNDGYENWRKTMNVSVAYSRFDSAFTYLKRKVFKVKAPIEIEGGKVNEIWS